MSESAAQPIGVFDSGVGGLTVMRAIVEALPAEDVIYLGDTARVPYGNRGADTVRRYAINAAELLGTHQIKALVIACNTASAFALEALRNRLKIPVFGVIAPAARQAAKLSRTGKIAILGTRGTIRSDSYQRALLNLRPDLDVHPLSCPLLVPLAEEGWLEGPVTHQVLKHYLEPLANTDVDTMILGCTHYPLFKKAIAQVLAELPLPPITLVDSANTTAAQLASELKASGLLRQGEAPGERRFLVTDLPEGFILTAERFFGRPLDGTFQHVDIADASNSPSDP